MRNDYLFQESGSRPNSASNSFTQISASSLRIPRQSVIGVLLILALFAFELFNFDTTRFALDNLLGEVSFFRIRWATILAIAFCAIDFAGLAYLFTPERGAEEPKEIWYLMGAWLLGATMNALMTWWAVNLTLLEHQLGNEVLSRQQLLEVVPPFVAVLVWLTRILFIGAFSVAGEHFLETDRDLGLPLAVMKKRPSFGDRYAPPLGAGANPTDSRAGSESRREQAESSRHSSRRPPLPQTSPAAMTAAPLGASGPRRR